MTGRGADDDLELRRRRLRFRCWHRGMKEADLLLGSFVDQYGDAFDSFQLAQLESLMPCGDPDIVRWLSAGGDPPVDLDPHFAELLKNHKYRFDLN